MATDLPKQWATFAEACGGIAQMSKDLKVRQDTIISWANGEPMSKANHKKLWKLSVVKDHPIPPAKVFPDYTKVDAEGQSYGPMGRRGTSMTGAWLALALAYGGQGGLAKAIGVSESTLYRYAVYGKPMSVPVRQVVLMLAASKHLAAPPMTPVLEKGSKQAG